MIEFNCPNRKFDGTPVVCDLEVMAYAEAQVGEYKSELLKAPGSSRCPGNLQYRSRHGYQWYHRI